MSGNRPVALDQAQPEAPAVGTDGQAVPHKYVLTKKDLQLLAALAVKIGETELAQSTAADIGEEVPHVGFTKKMTPRGETIAWAVGAAVMGGVLGSTTVAAVGAFRRWREKNQQLKGGKVLRLPVAASK